MLAVQVIDKSGPGKIHEVILVFEKLRLPRTEKGASKIEFLL